MGKSIPALTAVLKPSLLWVLSLLATPRLVNKKAASGLKRMTFSYPQMQSSVQWPSDSLWGGACLKRRPLIPPPHPRDSASVFLTRTTLGILMFNGKWMPESPAIGPRSWAKGGHRPSLVIQEAWVVGWRCHPGSIRKDKVCWSPSSATC